MSFGHTKRFGFHEVINDDDNWSPSTEFKIVLTHPQHCKLGQDLQHCRVKVIDDDAFPGNKHREEILKGEDAIWNISGFSLFMEFFRLNFISEGIGWRTVLTVALDQLKNAYLMLTLAMKTYLINVVLDTSKPTESLIFPDRRLCAIVIGIMYILPLWILHVWDYHKLALDVQGRTKMFIQTTLFRKYLNYSEKSRRSMTPAQMNHAITQDPACWWVVAMMPSLMILFGLLRGDAMSKVTRVSSTVQEAVVAFVSESCDKYSLIAEYSRRPVMSDIFEKKANLARLSVIPEQQVALNNNYFPRLGSSELCFVQEEERPRCYGGGFHGGFSEQGTLWLVSRESNRKTPPCFGGPCLGMSFFQGALFGCY
ncbi:unnamed protein product [Effrenium voratum]|nr:unnamed protein product [Effrenium voratum]